MDESLEPGTYIPSSPPSLALLHLRFIIPAFFIHPHLQSSWLLRLSRIYIYNTSNTERVGANTCLSRLQPYQRKTNALKPWAAAAIRSIFEAQVGVKANEHGPIFLPFDRRVILLYTLPFMDYKLKQCHPKGPRWPGSQSRGS